MEKLIHFLTERPLYLMLLVVCIACLGMAANEPRWHRDLESELSLDADQGQIVSYRCGISRRQNPVLALRLETYRQEREFYSSGILDCDRVGDWWQEAWAEVRYDRAGQLWSLMVEGHLLISLDKLNDDINASLTGYRRLLIFLAGAMAFFIWQSFHRYNDPPATG